VIVRVSLVNSVIEHGIDSNLAGLKAILYKLLLGSELKPLPSKNDKMKIRSIDDGRIANKRC
jgi:hypothetical protein